MAANMLLRAVNMAANTPFMWAFIDKPPGWSYYGRDLALEHLLNISVDGQVYLVYLPPNSPFPNDGIRWLETETRYQVPIRQGGMPVRNPHLQLTLTV